MKNIIEIIEIIVSVVLIILVLFQQRGSGLGGVFGGGGEVYHRRRGMENLIFRGTVAAAVIFLISSIAIYLVK